MIHYFDNSATTKTDDAVVAALQKYHTEKYFNPSARSSYSADVASDIALARQKTAELLGAENYNIYFTSGGTESNNIGIFGLLKAKKGNVVVTSAEHSAVYNTVLELKNRGYEVRVANVLPDGHIDVADFVSRVDDQTLLACFMHVNNETGAINDVKTLTKAVRAVNKNTVCFSDGVQAAGKMPVNLADLDVDVYTLSAHKFHASKGVGALFVKKTLHPNSLVFGGGQERGLRSGTEYVGGIVTLPIALESAVKNLSEHSQNYLLFKDAIRSELASLPDWHENCTENCLPAIMSLAFAEIKAEVLLHMLERYEIIVGTGSACSSKNKQSRIACAINLDDRLSEGILRISFSKYNTLEEAHFLGEKLRECVTELRQITMAR